MQTFPPGLTAEQARRLQREHGKNELVPPKKQSFARKVLGILKEPMFLLLLAAAVIYFILGEARDGAIMLVFVTGIIAIDVIQEWKTDKTLNALKSLAEPRVTVIRDGAETQIAGTDLVPGDLALIHEGMKIPADGAILRCSDLCVDESSLTGEAEGVWKGAGDACYAGSLVLQGTALLRIETIGLATEYGKIGAHVAAAKEEKTPLQKQTGRLVRLCTGIAAVLFALVGAVTWVNLPDHLPKDRVIESILSGITLTMAMIPEEFPVILTVFLSMGAWRLGRKNSLVRRLPSVETLGAVSVLCVDKTGTITRNQMAVREVWAAGCNEEALAETMGLACETEAYDPMEKAMVAFCEGRGIAKDHLFGGELITEYAFTNELKMMGHVWRHEGEILIAAKGSPEHILDLCHLSETQRQAAEAQILAMSGQGLRVIAVGISRLAGEEEIPAAILDCELTLCGLIGLADPPREGVAQDIAQCNRAGIRVVMITGDNGVTAAAIARQIGMRNIENIITGDMLESMTDEELRERVKDVSIFSRVVPEHKMRIVQALKANGGIVAMTGDGVNDAPALKHADIGIAMGRRGSEVSREAADLILMDDNFSTIVETVRDGRRIFDNIRRAVGYVFTIHVPIALSSLLAPLLGVAPAALMLLPLHVVLLELVIDPTCSVVLERQPAERDIMARPHRSPREPLLTPGTLVKSLLQGLAVFAASFGAYYTALKISPAGAAIARSLGITILMLANLLLVQVNSSSLDSVFVSMRRLMKDKVMWAANVITLAGLAIILYTPANGLLGLAPLGFWGIAIAAGLAGVSVLWYEIVKWGKRKIKKYTSI